MSPQGLILEIFAPKFVSKVAQGRETMNVTGKMADKSFSSELMVIVQKHLGHPGKIPIKQNLALAHY